MMRFGSLSLIVVLAFWRLAIAEQGDAKSATPLPQAHAHNDYEHEQPLVDALAHGFCSVEADIHLVDGQLLVAHDLEDVASTRTLESLYLKPLAERVKQNGESVYADGPDFYLLIDIKSDGDATYPTLDRQLTRYRDILSSTEDGDFIRRAVTVVVSGNRPFDLMKADQTRFAGVDGRLSDLDSDASPDYLPWISDNWNLHFRWRGDGPFPDVERRKLLKIIRRAHDRDRMVRFWATSDKPAVWRELRAANADLINADNLAGLQHFLTGAR